MTDNTPFLFTSYNATGEGIVLTPQEQIGGIRGRLLVCFPGVNRVGELSADTHPNVVIVPGAMWRATLETIEDNLAKGKTVIYQTMGDCFTYLREEQMSYTVVYPSADQKMDYRQRLIDDGKEVVADSVLLHWDKLQSMFRLATECNHLEINRSQLWLRDLFYIGLFR